MKIFPIPDLFDGRVAISPCPKGGEDLDNEIHFLQQQGYRLVVSMLSVEEQEVHRLMQEGKVCSEYAIQYLNFPIYGEVSDNDEQTLAFVKQVKTQINELVETDKVLFHCRGGVGRSSMIIALVIANEQLSIDEVFAKITLARGEKAPESDTQRQWVKGLHKKLSAYA